MKIGICVNHFHPSVGGAELVAKTIADYLSSEHKVFVFTRKLKEKRNPTNYPYPIYEHIPGDESGFDKRIKSLQLDLVLIYSDVFDFFRPLINQKNKFKLIVALCGANWTYQHRGFLTVFRHAKNVDKFICHSKFERDYKLCQSENLIQKTVIIPNGVWTSEFDNNTLKRKDILPDLVNKKWILNVSNFFPGKGQEHLIDILSELSNPEQLVYIQVCNDIEFPIGHQLEQKWTLLSKHLKQKGMIVKLLKNQPRDKVIGLFKQSNAFAFTSEKEVAPIVLLESMAASLPWISANIGNAEELAGGKCVSTVKNSQFHVIFGNRTKSIFAQELQSVMNSPSLGEEGRKLIDKQLTWDKILPMYQMII